MDELSKGGTSKHKSYSCFALWAFSKLVEPFNNAKDLMDKLLELHEGTSNSYLLIEQLQEFQIFQMKDRKMINHIHVWFIEIINNLHAIVLHVNKIRYILKSSPITHLWTSMVRHLLTYLPLNWMASSVK